MNKRNTSDGWHFREAEESRFDGGMLVVAAMLVLTVALIFALTGERLTEPRTSTRANHDQPRAAETAASPTIIRNTGEVR